MNREVHVRFCESVGVKFPRATRPLIHTLLKSTLPQDLEKKKAESRTPHFHGLDQDKVLMDFSCDHQVLDASV